MRSSAADTRTKLLDSALRVFRQKGYAATTVDDLCREAKLTKGSFFYHFASKEELAAAAAGHFAAKAAGLFATAPYTRHADPADRLLGYVDFRVELLRGPVWEFTCLLGTFVQELHETHPALRAACEVHLRGHVGELARDAAEARCLHAPDAAWSAEGLALHMQAVLQGSLIFAKARGGPEAAVESLGHLRRYLELLLRRGGQPLTS